MFTRAAARAKEGETTQVSGTIDKNKRPLSGTSKSKKSSTPVDPLTDTAKTANNTAETETETEIYASTSANSNWRRVTHRRKRRPVLRGTAIEHKGLTAVERRKYIHAWQFDANTTVDDIMKFLLNINKEIVYDVVKLTTKADYASFRIGVPESKLSFYMDPNIWPNHVAFNEWFFRRNAATNDATKHSGSEK